MSGPGRPPLPRETADALGNLSQEYVSARAVARYWGVHLRTVYHDIQKGALPHRRLPSGAIRIARADALAYGTPGAPAPVRE